MTDPGSKRPDRGTPSPGDPGYTEWVESVAFSPEGVDRSLILENLRRSPSERLAELERTANRLLALRGWMWPDPE